MDMLDPEEARLVFAAAQLFFQHEKSAAEIAKTLDITREAAYPLLMKARRYGFVSFKPPLEEELARRIAQKYSINQYLDPAEIIVVNARGESSGEQVAKVAADLAVELLQEVAPGVKSSGRKTCGLALAPGRATRDASRCLAERLKSHMHTFPKLTIFGLASGCPISEPQYSSLAFFSSFPEDIAREFVGLFATTLVESRTFEQMKKKEFGVKEAFKKVEATKDRPRFDSIDVILTSMGDLVTEPHDLLRRFLCDANPRHLKMLQDAGAVGSVCYRPFSPTGPVMEKPTQLRPVTLMELQDMLEFRKQPNKYVILIARECGLCHESRLTAVQPLLEVPELKIWNRLVLDLGTARDLLGEKTPEPVPDFTSRSD